MIALLIFFAFSALMFIATFLPFGASSDAPVGGSSTIAVLEIEGAILTADAFREQIRRLENSPSVRAVVVSIESPGGAVAASQEMHDTIKRLAESKHVVVTMGNTAASGGYYAALGADHIFAQRGTVTGSIGVYSSIPNIEGLMDKIGVDQQTIASGKLKGAPSMYESMTPEQTEYMRGFIDELFDQFLGDVLAARGDAMREAALAVWIEEAPDGAEMPEEWFLQNVKDNIADGRVFTGRQAVALGLVDEMGTFEDAVAKAESLAGIKEGTLRWLTPEPTLADVLYGRAESLAENVMPQSRFQYKLAY